MHSFAWGSRNRSILIALVAATASATPALTQEREGERRDPRPDRSHVGLDYTFDWFHGDFDPWHLAAFSVGRRNQHGTFIGRVNYAHRFDDDAVQGEVDAYPRLGSRMYAYLNAGYSDSRLFPRWRAGGELFVNLPRAWETSAGVRQLEFEDLSVTMLTGSLGKYVGNYWYSARPFVQLNGDSVSASLALAARRYFEDADNFVGVRASAGSTPSDRMDPTELVRSSGWSAAVHGSRTMRPLLIGTWAAGVEHERLSSAVTRRRIGVSLGIRREF